ncbi:MAG: type I-E CRISPR-associated protein Cse2/CasB [Clostridiales bacterium]|jgi:CRISPR system Cascade subunit CasB|nr:type I-E CRISPR-associated protein Cse2/CasB [Clostridiales bacterium]
MAIGEKSPAKLAGNFVRRKINQLFSSQNDTVVRAELARLRRGIGKLPGSMPELWDITMKDLPEILVGKDEKPSYGEWAVYTTLTLFALHQQGKDLKSQCMNQEGMFLGKAVRTLIQTSEDENRVKRRFDAAATSNSMEEIAHHLRGLIQLLKSENIPLDYPKLTEDLYRFQFPEARDNVRLMWGREFYSMQAKSKE